MAQFTYNDLLKAILAMPVADRDHDVYVSLIDRSTAGDQQVSDVMAAYALNDGTHSPTILIDIAPM
jgi:hypothetical protein